MADEAIELDLDTMTLGELDDMEGLAGEDAFKRLLKGETSAKALLAVAVVIKRRTDPEFTIEDARNIRVAAFQPVAAEAGKDDAAA